MSKTKLVNFRIDPVEFREYQKLVGCVSLSIRKHISEVVSNGKEIV